MSTKIHAVADALGLPVRLLASPGQRTTVTRAADLIARFAPDANLADKAYDTDPLCEAITQGGAEVAIPQA